MYIFARCGARCSLAPCIVCLVLATEVTGWHKLVCSADDVQLPASDVERERAIARIDRLRDDAERLEGEGDHAGAEASLGEVLRIEQELYGNDSAELIGTLEFLARCQEGRGAWPDAHATRTDVLRLSREEYGEDDYRSINARWALQFSQRRAEITPEERAQLERALELTKEAGRLYGQAKYADATPIVEEALEIRRQLLGEEHPQYALTIDFLSVLYRMRADYPNAFKLSQRAVELRKSLLGEFHPHYSTSLFNLAGVHYLSGRHRDAEPLFSQVIEIQTRLFGPVNTLRATALNQVAILHKQRGDYAGAESLCREALEINRQYGDERRSNCASNLFTLSGLYHAMGNHTAAEQMAEEAAQLHRATAGERHPDYATAIDQLGFLACSRGDYARAERLSREAMMIRRETLGTRHPDFAASLGNLASVYRRQQEFAQAQVLILQSLETWKQAVGTRHPRYLSALSHLADLYQQQGDWQRAMAVREQVLEVRMDVFGEQHPEYAAALSDMATTCVKRGDYHRAEALFQQALQIRKSLHGEDHPHCGFLVSELAAVYRNQGEFEQATPLCRQALRIAANAFGEQHPRYVSSLRQLALVLAAQGAYDEALESARSAIELGNRLQNTFAPSQSERQQLAMLRKTADNVEILLSVAQLGNVPAESVYPSIVALKGQVFAQQQAIRSLRRQWTDDPDSDAARAFAALADRCRELDRIAKVVPGAEAVTSHRQRLQRASMEIEGLQRRLAELSSEYARGRQADTLTVTDVIDRLPRDVAYIDFWQYSQFVPPTGELRRARWRRQYAAFVLRSDKSVEVVWLGDATPIDALIFLWRQNVSSEFGGLPGAELRRHVWDPLQKHLDGAKVVLVSPEGALNLLSFAALPGREPGTYLLDDHAFATVSSVPVLAQLLTRELPRRDAPRLLAVGGIDYDNAPPSKPADSAPTPRDPGWQFTALPHTQVEVESVQQTFRAAFSDGVATVLTGAEASAERVIHEAPQCMIIHLATHGYFAPEQLQSVLSMTSGVDDSDDGLPVVTDVIGWHPGLLSGIALAGANRVSDSDSDDGILTALEVSELDLANVELVALSACDTGLGRAAGGEGLLGLQRAFHLAGARSTLASLWSVPDEATSFLMSSFYNNLWGQEMSRVEALRQAQLGLIHQVRMTESEGSTPSDKRQSLPPAMWAAFVLSGEWR